MICDQVHTIYLRYYGFVIGSIAMLNVHLLSSSAKGVLSDVPYHVSFIVLVYKLDLLM